MGNCFGGMFAQQVEHKFVKRRLLLAVLDEVPTLMNQGKRLCSPNLSQALFMLVCLERLLNRDGAKRLKDGSTLTMALGGTIVFRKFFSTGPARQVIQERSGEGGGGKKGGKKAKGRSAAAEGGWLDPSASAGAGAVKSAKSFTPQELKAIATYVKIVCEQPNLNVVVGVDDFSAFVKYRKGSLTYVVCDVKPKPVRVLIYESFKLTAAEDAEIENSKTTPERVVEAEMKFRAIDESEDATTKKKMKSNAASKKDAAVITEGNETLPKCVEALALAVLNDKSYETTEIRATELRKRFSENFGDYWHVIHDDNPFVVACDKTTFTIIENEKTKKNDRENDQDGLVEKELYFVAQKGRAVYTVWHHNAPTKEKFFAWFWRMESSEKLKLLRYFCLFNATGLAVISRAICGFEEGGKQNTKSIFCQAGPTFTPVLIGIFLCIAFSTSVFAKIRRNKERRLANTLSAAVAVTSPSKRNY